MSVSLCVLSIPLLGVLRMQHQLVRLQYAWVLTPPPFFPFHPLSLSPMRHMYSARIVSYADTDRRCYWFGVLCGVVQPAVGEGEYLEVGIDVALAFLRRVIPEDTIKERLNVVGQQKGGNPVGLDEACRAATDLFVSFVASEHMSALLSQMEAAAVPGACTDGGNTNA